MKRIIAASMLAVVFLFALGFLSDTTAGERIEFRAKHCNVGTKFEAVKVGDEPGHVLVVTEAKGIGVRIEGAPGGPYKLDLKGTGDYRSDHTGTNKGYGKTTYPDGRFIILSGQMAS